MQSTVSPGVWAWLSVSFAEPEQEDGRGSVGERRWLACACICVCLSVRACPSVYTGVFRKQSPLLERKQEELPSTSFMQKSHTSFPSGQPIGALGDRGPKIFTVCGLTQGPGWKTDTQHSVVFTGHRAGWELEACLQRSFDRVGVDDV